MRYRSFQSQVEDTLFRVHRYYFTRESQIFADMFSLPVSGAGGSMATMEGKTDSSPIEIPGVTKLEMESFLGFVYFGYVPPPERGKKK